MRHIWIAGLALCTASMGTAADALYANQYLFPNQRIMSRDCGWYLEMQTDGNLVLYTLNRTAKWATNTNGRGGAYAVMQSDGNFVLYDWNHRPLWAAGTEGHADAHVIIQDDGNLVVYHGSNALWATNTVWPPIGHGRCRLTSSFTQIEPNTDRPGSDFHRFAMRRPMFQDCANSCAQNGACKAFTYVPPGVQGPSAMCWLKNAVPGGRYQPGMFSGVIRK